MTRHYPIVFEREDSGAISAYVPGLPVYAAADTHSDAERAIRHLLAAYLGAHPTARPDVEVRAARVSERKVAIVGVAALVGATRSVAKARAARANGRLGGRPRARATSKRTKAAR
jgi:predicted RNase H-like HicB family nuclease